MSSPRSRTRPANSWCRSSASVASTRVRRSGVSRCRSDRRWRSNWSWKSDLLCACALVREVSRGAAKARWQGGSAECLLVVGDELLEPHVRQRVLHAVLDHLDRAGGHVGPGQGAVQQVVEVADGGREDLGLVAVVVVDLADGADELHAVLAHVVEAAD